MNNVNLIGRLTKKPEIEYLPSGKAITKFTIAIDRGKDKGADFPRITAFDKQAENVCRYMDKGRQVAVTGRIQTGSYEDRDGKKVYTTDIIAERVEFLGSANTEREEYAKEDNFYNSI